MTPLKHSQPYSDTHPKALEVFLSLQRQMTPAQKVSLVLDFTEMLFRLAEADVRQTYPEASEREIFLRAAARRLDRETMIRVYGWDPQLQSRSSRSGDRRSKNDEPSGGI